MSMEVFHLLPFEYEPRCEKTGLRGFRPGVTAKLICVFVFANAKSRFSHDEAHILRVHVCLCAGAYTDCK